MMKFDMVYITMRVAEGLGLQCISYATYVKMAKLCMFFWMFYVQSIVTDH